MLARRDTAAEDQGFGAAGDAGEERADEDFAVFRLTKRHGPEGAFVGALNPESLFHVFSLAGDRRLVSPPPYEHPCRFAE
ncbi:hypothetical protein Amsp01_013130 [Amycolatopsis sp. NBRC 101858]|nr:hypothetical protein Amsp01_013130 [Amycolatopsis sp. NBRC 101858]